MSTSSESVVEPFYLSGVNGQLFCLFHGPAPGSQRSGAVLLVPPFAEEMNKSRRQMVSQARALAAVGYDALIVDLFGTGDSGGDFADASWETWLEDLLCGARWLQGRGAGRLTLLGLRLGALLVAELAQRLPDSPERLIFWQPVIGGRQHIDQFLRLRVASALLGSGEGGVTIRGLRESLARGESIEVAGYDLHPKLVEEIDSRELSKLAPGPAVGVEWLELVHVEGRSVAPASERVVAGWKERSVEVRAGMVVGEQFWSTVEIVVVPTLIEHTTRLIAGNT